MLPAVEVSIEVYRTQLGSDHEHETGLNRLIKLNDGEMPTRSVAKTACFCSQALAERPVDDLITSCYNDAKGSSRSSSSIAEDTRVTSTKREKYAETFSTGRVPGASLQPEQTFYQALLAVQPAFARS